MMRAFVFALATSVALAYRDYIQSYVQVDSDLDDDLQFDEPVELPEVDTSNPVAAHLRGHHKKSQVNADASMKKKPQLGKARPTPR